MDLNLKDKVALVTGGSRGLGRAICKGLAAEGAKVVVNYRRTDASAVVREIKETYGTEVLAVRADVSKESEVVEMFRQLDERFGRIDILVNNAALCPTGWVREMSAQTWTDTINVNLNGAFFTSREMLKRLFASGRKGRIINIVSQAAFRGSTSGHAPYDASKGGLVSLTIALAREAAEQGTTVNAVAPGLVSTEMVAEAIEKNREKYLARVPLRRIAEPEEVANVVVFLASDKAAYMTGATVDVSGGMLMR